METEEQRKISEWLDKRWKEHILACLAIINTFLEEDDDEKEDEEGPDWAG